MSSCIKIFLSPRVFISTPSLPHTNVQRYFANEIRYPSRAPPHNLFISVPPYLTMASMTSSTHATHGSAKSPTKSRPKSKSSGHSTPSRTHEDKYARDISITKIRDEHDIILEENEYSTDRFLIDPTNSTAQFLYSSIEDSIQAHTGRMKMELMDFDRIFCQEQQSTA